MKSETLVETECGYELNEMQFNGNGIDSTKEKITYN